MKTRLTLHILCILAGGYCYGQVKPEYQYSTSMPYGTLDIRTSISSTYYYYLQENKTFSFRESAPGVKTNTYLDMTSWDSGPYLQGNLRQKNGTKDNFIMNYRLLFPAGYKSTYTEGYPMIVILHGAIERGNCYYSNCYHATPSYTVIANSPAAPKIATHKLLNNDHNVSIGGKEHLDARNLAGTRLPNDPSMPSRAFPGFVLIPQMFNVWEPLQVEDMIRTVRLLAARYRIDQNRIYIHGLSIGGYGVYEAMKRASWLFAAALPMSAIRDADIFKHNQQARVAHLPVWIFQGAKDAAPTATYTQSVINNLKKAGSVVRYSLYTDLGHVVWNRAFSQADFFTWMLSKTKTNLHAFAGNTVIDKSMNRYPKLMLAEGFLAYQWEKNGVIISTAKSPTYTATTPGTYRARFSRLSSVPMATQWNKWSSAVKVTEVTTTTLAARTTSPSNLEIKPEPGSEEEGLSFDVYPNPATAGNVNLHLRGGGNVPVQVVLTDQLGKEVYTANFESHAMTTDQPLLLPDGLQGGVYILVIRQGQRQLRKKVVLRNEKTKPGTSAEIPWLCESVFEVTLKRGSLKRGLFSNAFFLVDK